MAKSEPIQLRTGTNTEFSTRGSRVYRKGEACLESNTGRIKVGDGSTDYDNLDYFFEKGPVYLKSYTVAQAEAIQTTATRGIVWVSDESGGAQPAYCDGTNFRRFSDGAVIS